MRNFFWPRHLKLLILARGTVCLRRHLGIHFTSARTLLQSYLYSFSFPSGFYGAYAVTGDVRHCNHLLYSSVYHSTAYMSGVRRCRHIITITICALLVVFQVTSNSQLSLACLSPQSGSADVQSS